MKKLSLFFLIALFSFGNIYAQEKSPKWIKDLIVYEISTKNFNSPGKPESGTFKSVKEKLPYLQKLGINSIWMSGHSLSDYHHFYNIWTQYACIRPDSLDSSLGTREEFRELIKEAHKRGIRVFLDIITHGVMSGSSLIKEHPDWFKGGSWGMTDYDWKGNHKDLDKWWVDMYTDYCLKDGIDGYRLDVDYFRSDLWKQIRQNCLDAGKEIAIIQENMYYNDDMVDFYQNPFRISQNNTSLGLTKDDQVTDPGKFYNDKMKYYSGEWREKRPEGNAPDHFYISLQLSCHDNGWDGYPSDLDPYVAKGSRSVMGYNLLLAPNIPILMSGEEFNADYVPIPWHAGSLFGDTKKNEGRWLYASWIQWDQLKDKNKQEMLDDVKRMISIRKEHSDLICGLKIDEDPEKAILSVKPISGDVTNPYIICKKGEKAILVAGNQKDESQQITIRIPYAEMGFDKTDNLKIKDIWNKKSKQALCPKDGIFKFNIGADHTANGGLAVYLIEY